MMYAECMFIMYWSYFRLGLAYAGSNRDDVLQLILPVLGDSKASMEVILFEPVHNQTYKMSHVMRKPVLCHV